MSDSFPEPTDHRDSRAEVFLGYLDYFRDRVLDKVRELPVAERTSSRLPSGWTPLQLIKHLTHMERRWLEWGFAGRPVPDPWGDQRDGVWITGSGDLDVYTEAAGRQATTTAAIVRGHPLDEIGQPGPRWDGASPPSLERVLLHVLQEYARHLGQLDIVAELTGGALGE